MAATDECLHSLSPTPGIHTIALDAHAGAARRAGELDTRNVANILHGFATMDHHPGEALLQACAARAVDRIWEATPQAVANTVWSFAKLQHSPGGVLLAACAAQAVNRIRQATPQEVTNTLWSYAKLQHHPGDALLAACAARAVDRIWEAIPRDVAITVWSFATLQHHPGDAMLQSFEAAAVRSAAAFNQQEMVCDPLQCFAVHMQHSLASLALTARSSAHYESLKQTPCPAASLQGRSCETVQACSFDLLLRYVRRFEDSAQSCVACKAFGEVSASIWGI